MLRNNPRGGNLRDLRAINRIQSVCMHQSKNSRRMRSFRERDFQCTSLNRINEFKPRDLYQSHAERTGKTKQQIVYETFNRKDGLYHPHPYTSEPVSTPVVKLGHKHKDRCDENMIKAREQLVWMRRIRKKMSAGNKHKFPTTYDRQNIYKPSDLSSKRMNKVLNRMIQEAMVYKPQEKA